MDFFYVVNKEQKFMLKNSLLRLHFKKSPYIWVQLNVLEHEL